MTHNCPSDWVYYPFFGCFESQQAFVDIILLTFVTVSMVTAGLLAYRRWWA